MKKIFTGIMGLMFVFTLVTLFSTDASAQRWGRGYNKMQVDAIIRNVEDRTDRFVDQLDYVLDHSNLDGSHREDIMNRTARQLEKATDELRSEFDRHDSWRENRDEVSRCLNIANELDFSMRGSRSRNTASQNWAGVRAELNALANVYGLPRIGSRY